MLSKQIGIEQTNASVCMRFHSISSGSHSHVTICSGYSTSPSSQFMDTNFGTHRRRNPSISHTLFRSRRPLSLVMSQLQIRPQASVAFHPLCFFILIPFLLPAHISTSSPRLSSSLDGVTVASRCRRLLFQGRNPVENIFGLNIYFDKFKSQICRLGKPSQSEVIRMIIQPKY